MSDAETPLDRLHAAMQAAPEDPAPRLRFYARLAASELFVLLDEEPAGDRLFPALVEIEGTRAVLAFDTEERLAAFAEGAAPYAALSGRALAAMLAGPGPGRDAGQGQALGLGLNLGVAPSAFLMPGPAVEWLAATLAAAPAEARARPRSLHSPQDAPEALRDALAEALPAASGLAREAWLAGAEWQDGSRGHLLAIVGAPPAAHAALAQAAAEAVIFSGLEAGSLDVAFFAAEDPLVARLANCGWRFDLAPPPRPARAVPAAPGSDPARPPRLK